MKRKSMGFKIGIILAVFHLCAVIFAFIAATTSHSSTAALVYVIFFLLDAPIILLPFSFEIFGTISPVIQFGVLGSALWFLIPWLMDIALARVLPDKKQILRAIIIIAAIPLILIGFYSLSSFLIDRSISQERPEELKKTLNTASSDFLNEKIVFEDNNGSINSINWINCRQKAGVELILAMVGEVIFLNENYQEQRRLKLSPSTTGGFNWIEPLNGKVVDSCQFLAYRFGKGAYLFDSDGKTSYRESRIK